MPLGLIGRVMMVQLLFLPLAFAARWTAPSENRPSFKIGIVGTTLSMDISDEKGEIKPQIKYRPNSLGRLVFGVEYLGYGLSAGLTPKGDSTRDAQYGSTNGIDYQFRFFREENTFEFFYQKYSGFYIENSSEIDPSIQGTDPYLQRGDLESEHLGIQYFRTLNPENFSLAACFDQSGWQKESGGTWFLYSGLDQHGIHADSGLIPSSLTASYSSLISFTQGHFTTAKIGFGGAYALVYSQFFIAAQLVIAGGQQKQVYHLDTESIDRLIPTSGGNLKLSFGYNGDRYFSSIKIFNDSTSLSIKDRKINMGTLEIGFNIGTHL